jgi:hypothetical protein
MCNRNLNLAAFGQKNANSEWFRGDGVSKGTETRFQNKISEHDVQLTGVPRTQEWGEGAGVTEEEIPNFNVSSSGAIGDP